LKKAFTKQNINIFVNILSKLQAEEPQVVLFKCLSKYNKFIDEAAEVTLLGKNDKLIALKP